METTSPRPLGTGFLPRKRLGPPDATGVLHDRAIARELAGMPDVDYRPARPGVGLLIECAGLLLDLHVGRQVGEVHVVIAMGQQRFHDRPEDARLAPVEGTGADEVQGATRLWLVLVVPVGIVPATAALDLLSGQAEEEEVLLASRLGHLDRCPVASADGQSAVHHELHVARAARLVTGCEICSEMSLAGISRCARLT